MKFLSIFVLSLVLFQGCSKKDSGDNGAVKSEKCGDVTHAMLINKTGLDGCRWALRLDNGDYLEPTNLSDFDFEFVDNKSVAVNYRVRSDLVSSCMIGEVVDIICIDEYDEAN
ncbi:MAG TPA: hypothetical protein VEV83_13350 [Parafilimonas sp.]|nr:hypothetical protein [Parafilimonas sp.]